jgi:hypothetical protein
MAATRVGPEQGRMVFVSGALLKQYFSFGIENQNREGTVQKTQTMGLHFFELTNCLVLFIHQDNVFVGH